MNNKKRIARLILDITEIFVFAFVLAWGLRSTVVEARVVPTGSMLPTIQLQDRVVVDKLFYKMSDIKRGDIVVFHPPAEVDSSGEDWIKRVIGLPGETVEIKNGSVYIDGVRLKENYELEQPDYKYGPMVVPPKTYFVLGDNRNNSLDSHYWGTLPAENIIGKALFRYWPLKHFGALAR